MTLTDIQKTIETSIPGARAMVMDPMGDGEHLQAIVVAEAFDGLPLVKQHQMVMKPLTQAFASSVHALALKTFTPSRWEQDKQKFGF